MTRVSILVPGLARGGMMRAYALAGAMVRAGARVEIAGALDEGEDVYPAPPAGLALVPLPAHPFALRALEARALLSGDILFAIKPRATSFGVALLCRRGRPVVVDVDDWDAGLAQSAPPRARPGDHALRRARRRLRRARNLDRPRYTAWMERHLHRADAVTANTRFLVERCGAFYLPSAVDTDHFDPARVDRDAARRALGLERFRVVMFPGTVRPHKGVDDALAAVERLGWDDLRLVLVGGRDAGEDPARELARRAPGRVLRLDRFSVGDMPGVVASADVVVVPQRDTAASRAQFPIKLTDAMAMARPIVATDVGDIPELLGETAWRVPPSSPAEIARAIERVFADPREAARRGAAARERCIERFSHAALAPRVVGVIEEARRRHRDRLRG